MQTFIVLTLSHGQKTFFFLFSGFGGAWGMIAVGLFAEKDELEGFSQYAGLFHGGGFYLLGVQTLCCTCFIVWSSIVTLFLIWVRQKRALITYNLFTCG